MNYLNFEDKFQVGGGLQWGLGSDAVRGELYAVGWPEGVPTQKCLYLNQFWSDLARSKTNSLLNRLRGTNRGPSGSVGWVLPIERVLQR